MSDEMNKKGGIMGILIEYRSYRERYCDLNISHYSLMLAHSPLPCSR